MTAFMSLADGSDSFDRSTESRGPRFRPIGEGDRIIIRRLGSGLLIAFALAALFFRLNDLYSDKFFDVTGTAEWIWDRHRVASGDPIAFFATRDFRLPAGRPYTRIKILGDPEYTLYLNGVEVGGKRVAESRRLDVYDVSAIARTGKNRIVVAIRSANGVGGLILALDLSPESENILVTDRHWQIFRHWSPLLLVRDLYELHPHAPMSLGRPPMRRWNYLTKSPAPLFTPPEAEVPARQTTSLVTALPEFRTLAGVVVVGRRAVHATAYDFGPSRGYGRISLSHGVSDTSQVISVRYANDPSELGLVEGSVEDVVFAPGEQSVTDPEKRSFRYIIIYGCCDVAHASFLKA
jgi:hypothetical protein